VLGPGRRYSERDIIGHCGARLESFMVPKYVEFVDGLPKTDNGKIKRQALG
jgi:acyl-coenzyme A synthetase/AMP-(fatty) acid ligase